MKSTRFTTFCPIFFMLILFVCEGSDFKINNSSEHAFGAIADCQYCAIKGKGERKYSLSEDKLLNCVNDFNEMDLEFVVHLGDFIDRNFESFDVISPIFKSLKMPHYHVLGNHDFSVKDSLKKNVPNKMGMTSKYYEFKVNEWTFIVLDGNDISFHAYPKNSVKWKEASEYYLKNEIKSPKWNGAIGNNQLLWLKEKLNVAQINNDKVILFCHFPVYPPNVHNLWNAKDIIELIEMFPCVKAYINGHNHEGNYGIKNGVHYLTLKGMVNTKENSYAVIKVSDNSIEVFGHGREVNKSLLISK